MKLSDEAKAATAELKKYGAEIERVEIGGSGHFKIYYRYQGRVQFVTAASTGSDAYRGPQQARLRVRRALGVTSAALLSGQPHQCRPKAKRFSGSRAKRPVEIEALTPGRDMFGPLRRSPLYAAALCVASDQAFAAFFGHHLERVGHKIFDAKIKIALDAARWAE